MGSLPESRGVDGRRSLVDVLRISSDVTLIIDDMLSPSPLPSSLVWVGLCSGLSLLLLLCFVYVLVCFQRQEEFGSTKPASTDLERRCVIKL